MKVNSIFESISGEAGYFPQGTWVTFIRFQTCNLVCNWCDTARARTEIGGREMTVEEIMQFVKTEAVLITGGEPLYQPAALGKLIRELFCKNHTIQVETNGSIIPSILDHGAAQMAYWVVDYKCPSSQVTHCMPPIPHYIDYWKRYHSMIKFVVRDEEDIRCAVDVMQRWPEEKQRRFIVSPLDANGESIPAVVKQIRSIDEALLSRIVFSCQLHKLIGLP